MATTTMRAGATPRAPTDAERRYRRLLDEQKRSGLSMRGFAAQRGLNAGSLGWWKHKIAQRDRARVGAASDPTPEFLAVHVVAGDARSPAPASQIASASARPYEVLLRSGRVVRVPRDFDAASLCALVAALEADAC